jgi:hypothetical protein
MMHHVPPSLVFIFIEQRVGIVPGQVTGVVGAVSAVGAVVSAPGE